MNSVARGAIDWHGACISRCIRPLILPGLIMQKTSFWKAGHTPTLFASFFYFDLAFMVWVLLGPLAVQISKDLGLSPAQKGFMVAVPLLSGALLRIVMGLLVDHL